MSQPWGVQTITISVTVEYPAVMPGCPPERMLSERDLVGINEGTKEALAGAILSGDDALCVEILGFGQSRRIDALDLKGFQLPSLPKSIEQLDRLEYLWLAENRLTALPSWIGNLHHTLVISIDHNELTDLPEAFGKLSRLESLELSFNQLTSVPKAIMQLSHGLKHLNLSSNRLTHVPESVGLLSRLEELNLDSNVITQLPHTIWGLTKMRELTIEGNHFTTIPDAIGQLTGLRVLNIDRNHITHLPTAIGKLTRLRNLRCASNPLVSPTRSIARYWELTEEAEDAVEYIRNFLPCQRSVVAFLICHSRQRSDGATIKVDPTRVLASLPDWLAQEIVGYIWATRFNEWEGGADF